MTAEVKLHEKARKHFDQEANDLVSLVNARPTIREQKTPRGESSIAHKHVVAHLKQGDMIGDLAGSRNDLFENEIERSKDPNTMKLTVIGACFCPAGVFARDEENP